MSPWEMDLLHSRAITHISMSVLSQTFWFYMGSVIILVVGRNSGWAPRIRPLGILTCWMVSMMTIAVSRLYQTLDADTIMPFYLSLLNFLALCVVAREARQVMALFWYIVIHIIWLQRGNPRFHYHAFAYSLLWSGVYAVGSVLANALYRPNATHYLSMEPLDVNLSRMVEIAYGIGIGWIMVTVLLFQRFIQKNASGLLDRENYMHQLRQTNVELKKEVRRARAEQEVDLEAPLARVTQILAQVRDTQHLEKSITDRLSFIIGILSSDRLYDPNIQHGSADADVHDWLNTLLTTKDTVPFKMSADNLRPRPTLATIPAPGTAGAPAMVTAAATATATGTVTDSLPSERGPPGFQDSNLNLHLNLQRESDVSLPVGAGLISSGQSARPSLSFNKAPTMRVPRAPSSQLLQIERFVRNPELSRYFDRLEAPDFDVIAFDRAVDGNGMATLGVHLIQKYDLLTLLNLDPQVVNRWMLVVQEGYIATNPYHNSKHAADVLFCTHFYIRSPKIWPHLGPLDLLACIIAPLIHDYGHPGVNNAFLISTLDPLSLRYNDVAPLENYHAASVFDMMQSTELNLLETLPLESRRYVRDLVLTMVLATDMTAHFEWIGKFKTKLTSHTGFAYDQKTDKKLVLNMAIKATDINNAAKPNDLCVTWTNWCMEEFFLQGDQEKKRGMTVSMFMNRDNTDIPKCQIGFIDYIVTPLYEAWYAYLKEDMQAMMDNIDTNRQHWKKRVTT